MNKMILLEGIPPTLNLGVSFVKHNEVQSEDNLAYLSTFVEDKTHTLGIINLNLENIVKLKNFHYVYLEKEEEKWIKNNNKLKLLIPREFEENEIIRGFFNEEIEF